MIKPLDITPINTTNKLHLKCEHCGFEEDITLQENSRDTVVNIDYNGKTEGQNYKEINCPKCNEIIKEN